MIVIVVGSVILSEAKKLLIFVIMVVMLLGSVILSEAKNLLFLFSGCNCCRIRHSECSEESLD